MPLVYELLLKILILKDSKKKWSDFYVAVTRGPTKVPFLSLTFVEMATF